MDWCSLTRRNVLHVASFNGATSCVKALLEAGAAARAKSDDGETPKKMAKNCGNDDIAKILAAWRAEQKKKGNASGAGTPG